MPVVVTQGAPGTRPSLQHPRPGPRPEGAAALDRRTRDAGEGEGRLGEGIGGVVVRRVQEDPAPPQQPQDARPDGGDEPGDLQVGRRRGRVEAQRAVGGFREHAVEEQRVAVNVDLQPRTKPLNDRHRAGVAVGPPGAPRPPAVPAEHGAHEDRDDGPTERVVEGEAVAQPVRHGEDPLPDGHPGQDGLDEIRRLLGHAPAAATGAHRAAFAGQRHEALERTVVAPDPQKAMDEQPAPEEAAELAFDEARQADPVGARRRRGEEGLQVLPHDPVQDRVGGGARDVGSHGAGPSGFRAVRQCLAAARQNEIARSTEAPRCNTRRNRALHSPLARTWRP